MRATALLMLLASGSAAADELDGLATRYVRFSPEEIQEAREGGVVARVFDAALPKEVLCAAILRVSAPKVRVLEWLQRPENLEAGEPEQSGRFSDPPVLEDLAALTLDPSHLKILKECRVGACGMKLPAAVIARLRADLDGTRPDEPARAEAILREAVHQAARDYWTEGDGGLPVYADRAEPVPARERLSELFATSPLLLPTPLQPAPESAGRRPPGDGFLYWSKEPLWRRVVIRVAHVQIHEPSPDELQLASKLVFSNHFFEAGVSLTVYRGEPGTSGGWLLFVSRLRCDKRGSGGFSRLERGLIGMLVKRRLGSQWRAARAAIEGTDDVTAAGAR